MNALSDIKSKIEKNKEEKRERLLASATALFAEKNFNNTSISDIVNKAKVAKGTFYLYFGSLTVVSIFSLTKSLKTLIISMLLSFFIVKFVKLYVGICRIT